MGYLHISNLYKDRTILAFRRCYALEKVHGTSAHVAWLDGALRFYSGGEKHERFIEVFDQAGLVERFAALGHPQVTIYGESYGGKMQGMRETYGDEVRFVAFDVKIDDKWLGVTQAHTVTAKLGLDFVDYELVATDLDALDAERDKDSTQAIRNGCGAGKKREGVVLRPPFEVTLNSGARIIAKHKRDDFRETKTPRTMSRENLDVIANARAIAEEWVTPMRLAHVADKLPGATGMEHTGAVIKAMVDDVLREAEGEIVDSKAARREINSAAAKLWKQHVSRMPREEP